MSPMIYTVCMPSKHTFLTRMQHMALGTLRSHIFYMDHIIYQHHPGPAIIPHTHYDTYTVPPPQHTSHTPHCICLSYHPCEIHYMKHTPSSHTYHTDFIHLRFPQAQGPHMPLHAIYHIMPCHIIQECIDICHTYLPRVSHVACHTHITVNY